MDERLEKAFQTANFMATLSNLRRVAFEEFQQNLIFYYQGSSFTVDKELICFVKILIDQGITESIILDDNNIPLKIQDLPNFLVEIQDTYSKATNEYLIRYGEIKSKRSVEGIIDL